MRPIDADALIKQLAEVAQRANENAAYTGNRSSELTWDMAVKYIKNAPTFEQKKGNWVYKNRKKCECCRCGFVLDDWVQSIFYNYCPICGIEMEATINDNGGDDK